MDELIKSGRTTKYQKGEILIRPTDLGGEIFIITSGLVHAYTIEESGEKNIQIIYAPGEIFPLSTLINKKALNIYYEAFSNCEVVRVMADEAVSVLKTDCNATFELLEKVIKQLVLFKARVDNLEYRYARERIAYRLLLLAKRFGTEEAGVITMQRFSQEEIANTANVSRESVSRELRRFEKLGYIQYGTGTLKICDVMGLRKELGAVDTPLFIDDL